MKRSILAAFLLITCALAVLACIPSMRPSRQTAQSPGLPSLPAAQKNVRGISPDENVEYSSLLFPELDSGAVTAISILSPDASFEFLCRGLGDVSVNGHEADSEVFLTLISQIAELSVAPAEPIPEGSTPLLRLSVTADGKQYDAAFYSGGKSASHAFIKSGGSTPAYHRTAGWRVGTLMMTCEGTRIQDERGNESPAD